MRWVAAVAVLFIITPALHAQSWPVARSAHLMTWHDRLKSVVLLGGVDSNIADVLWGWDGTRWRQLGTGGPQNRGHFAMAYDAARDRLVVHGGAGYVRGGPASGHFADTWEWNGRTWRQIANAGGPGQRDHHAMVYDAARKQLVLFGGADTAQTFYNDTWAWDGRTWRKLADGGPPARTTHRMVYDARREVVVLFGGFSKNGLLNDTWEWDGARWRQANDSGPSARFATRMAYDAHNGRTLLYAGRGANGDLGDTWSWDGARWQRIDVTGPPVRNVHEMAYDASRRRVVMFGGFNAPRQYDDLWEFADGAWQQREALSFAPPRDGLFARGPYRVGYRVVGQRDGQRSRTPRRNFEGVAAAEPTSAALQFSVWYPAGEDGRALNVGDYRVLSQTSETLRAVTPEDRVAARNDLIGTARFGLNIEMTPADADALQNMPVHARGDATPLNRRFPLIVGGMEAPGGSYALAEYLASHGFVVVTLPSMSATRTEQATHAAIALDAQAHRLEVAVAFARSLPFADTARLGLIGKNFDGMAALLVQMRNMNADAVVTLDGWEGKVNSRRALIESPFFDALKLRVPYLTFQMDNPPSAELTADYVLFDRFKYAERRQYVLEGLEHVHLIQHVVDFPGITSGQRLAYDFYYRTIKGFLAAHVAADSTAMKALASSPASRGYADGIIAAQKVSPALPAVPIAAEVEAIVMSGDIAKLTTIFRAARARDPQVSLFSRGTLDLYAFRFARRGDRDRVIAIQRLATEAFPQSSHAFNNLGNALRDAGNAAEALTAFQKALELVPGDSELTDADRPQSRTILQNKIDALSR